jgi:hypothetical protein
MQVPKTMEVQEASPPDATPRGGDINTKIIKFIEIITLNWENGEANNWLILIREKLVNIIG